MYRCRVRLDLSGSRGCVGDGLGYVFYGAGDV